MSSVKLGVGVSHIPVVQRLGAGGLSLSVAVNGDETMTASVSGAFAPFSVTVNGNETMTASGG